MKFDDKKFINAKRALIEGYVAEKIVRKQSQTSSAIYVPKKFENKKVQVIIIPKDKTEEINKYGGNK
ncbi:MAG: hypothetical protein ACOCTT_00745 [archaeon]